MPTLYRLTAVQVKNSGVGKHEDGGGLRLVKRPDQGGQWVLRVTVHGRRREMGLGSLHNVSLKQAREEADKWRAMARQGLDPIAERDRQRREILGLDCSLNAIAEEAFEARKASLKEDGKAGRWFSPVRLHILPKMGKTPVTHIDQRLIRDSLNSIWHDRPEAAKKAASRLNMQRH